MQEFNTIEEVANKIKGDLLSQNDKKSIALLYAFNSTGKTRLSIEFDSLNDGQEQIKTLSYNAFLEDLFVWDNENYVLNFSPYHWVINLVKNQGLENSIADNFKNLINSKIEPEFDFENGTIIFKLASGNEEDDEQNVKISKAEESLLIWSVFYSVLELVIDELNTEEGNRSADLFNDLQFIVIDDPVSSIDDERLISLAVKLFDLLKRSENKDVNFLITTHHALFFNVLFNSIRRLPSREAKKYFYLFSRTDNLLTLEVQKSDTPFAYHLLLKNKIKEAIEKDTIERYHFNFFRTLLEKTANFLGYDDWGKCILNGEVRSEVVKIINLYSHGRYSELESKKVSQQEKDLLAQAFNNFLRDFNYNEENN